MTEAEIQAIEDLRLGKAANLKRKYQELFGEEPKSSNRDFLFRRIAWKLQANAEGGLSGRARLRAVEIADDADVRVRAPRGYSPRAAPPNSKLAVGPSNSRDWRLPPPGTVLSRRFGNRDVVVKVLRNGFEFDSRRYESLSAIAREVTGTRWNGLLFFGLTERRNG
jgi:hypothetical protein